MIVTPAFIVPRHDLSLIEIDHFEVDFTTITAGQRVEMTAKHF